MKAQTLNLTAAATRSLRIGRAPRTLVGAMNRVLFLCLLIALTTAGNCNSGTTLFKSNFDTTEFNQPPSPTQAVGTASVGGNVQVVPAPPNASPPAKWLQIIRGNDPTQVSSFQAKLTKQPGNGTYVCSVALVIPSGNSGPATLQFEPFNQPIDNPVGFLHFDFMPDGHVRIDDTSTTFGTFPLDQVFLVQVTLTINDTSQSAHIILSGAGASGDTTRNVIPALRAQALQFGTVRLFMGFPNVGKFFAQNLVVTSQS